MSVVVVTDSSACLPLEARDRWGIRTVPLHILLDGADLRDGVDDVPADIYARERVTTSGAGPEELAEVYRNALDYSAGSGVVAVHISSALSGTFGTAEQVAGQIGPGVRVIDSRSAAMGTGFAVLAAARAAAGGADLHGVAAAADAAVQRAHAYMVVQRLDNLRRSGRIGSAAAWLGTALSLKPLLAVEEGKLVLAQRIRTVSKAVASMIDRVCEVVEDRSAALAVHHVANPQGAQEVAGALAERLPVCEPAVITSLCPTLALHVGAGAVAVCVDVDPGGS
ncbi:fatty acid-binding protein DegV [Mycolicibacter heraklionensis]|uniref:Fatty acid-binding protein DegV n=1 Tax=Mycolicibacter heraklionensis TaxID=512402 RepID=A0AA91EUV7_9MYCO|nr:DegV family protein [Mycolicibacter heraklionensis]OBK85381.1 fatty acid-binding protein DegV [Mycolicibacter heraklionensis]